MPMYEENPSGPPLTFHDRAKTSAALGAMICLLRLANSNLSAEETQVAIKQLTRELRRTTGLQWSMLNAMQYLTGQRADKAIQRWTSDFAQAGLTAPLMDALVAFANDFCANGIAGKSLSHGLMVSTFKDRPMTPGMLACILELPGDVIRRIEASA
jgi:hypothetical protein